MEVKEASAVYVVTATPRAPKGYKQTEVGVIPGDWEVKPLGEIGESLIGLTYKPNDVRSSGILVLRSSNIQECVLRFDDNVFVRVEVPERIMVRTGDILICVRNGSRALIGKCAQIDDRAEGMTFGAFMAVFRTPFYRIAYHQFQSEVIKRQIREQLGATINQITNKSLNSFCVPLPPTKAEQEAIAEALSDADVLIESLEQLLAKKRHLKQGAMQELFTGKRRLPGFSGEWEVKRLGEIAHIKTGSRNNQDKSEDGEYPFFVRSATVERINSYSHDCEAILVPGEGGIGSIFHYIHGRFDVHQRVYAITQFSPDVSGKYVYLYMTVHFGAHAMQNSVKATVDSLRLPTFQEFEITLPPTVEEQTAIAAILSDMDAELAALSEKLAKARSVKQGMMQELLTGTIRLV
ncbi:MAG: restriction endonuclease subunit S [Thermoplasmataceae archaeon]